jgi:hypothetical protein
MEEEVVFFDKTIHLNKFLTDMIKVGVDAETGEDKFAPLDIESDEFKDWQEGLHMSIDGSIMGINASLVRPYINNPDVRAIRFGIKHMPREYKIKNKDDFYRLLAILTPLDELS